MTEKIVYVVECAAVSFKKESVVKLFAIACDINFSVHLMKFLLSRDFFAGSDGEAFFSEGSWNIILQWTHTDIYLPLFFLQPNPFCLFTRKRIIFLLPIN